MKPIIFTIICCLTLFSVHSQVVINEIMASSDSLSNLPDEYGEFDDWVELYNTGSETVDLTGYFITDDSAEPMKWAFPATTTIASEGYLIVWTDKDENNMQVPLHTNFKLSADGETVLLSNPNGAYVDSVAFGPQTTNMTYARIPNGTGDFEIHVPSFNFNNEDVNSNVEIERGAFNIYPNPATENITIEVIELPTTKSTIEVIDINGLVYSSIDLKDIKTSMNITELAQGTYYIKITSGTQTILRPFQKL